MSTPILFTLPLKNNLAYNKATKLEDSPYTSNWGHAYFVVFYLCDANAINVEAIKNCIHSEIMIAFLKLYTFLTSKGFKPWLHKIDNEMSPAIKEFIKSQQTNIQYTPPDMHRQNAAEWTIHTWKNHFIASIAGTPDTFPLIANFCHLTNQYKYVLNMIWLNQQNQKLSIPMAPPGTMCYVHIKHKCVSWGYHASNAWYLAPKLDHHRCYEVLVQKNGAVHMLDAVTFYHHAISLPSVSNSDQILKTTISTMSLTMCSHQHHLTNSLPLTTVVSSSSTPLMLCLL